MFHLMCSYQDNASLQKVNQISLKVKSGLTKRAPDAGESGAIPSIFLRLSIFPVGRRPAARPSAGNANRWVAQEQKPKPSLNNKFGSGIGSEIQSQFLAVVFFKSAFR
jgi:hypothetical protein